MKGPDLGLREKGGRLFVLAEEEPGMSPFPNDRDVCIQASKGVRGVVEKHA